MLRSSLAASAKVHAHSDLRRPIRLPKSRISKRSRQARTVTVAAESASRQRATSPPRAIEATNFVACGAVRSSLTSEQPPSTDTANINVLNLRARNQWPMSTPTARPHEPSASKNIICAFTKRRAATPGGRSPFHCFVLPFQCMTKPTWRSPPSYPMPL
jgi:hypothetical protein